MTLLQRFMLKVRKIDGGCWLWTGLVEGGYGRIKVDGRFLRAHRVSYLMHLGPIADGMSVCHSCDVPACVNPDHLWLGTQAENMADAASKNRMDRDHKAKGRSHYRAKLTKEQAIAIRDDARSQRVIAAEYGIVQAQVSRIKSGQHWAFR